MSDQKGTGMNIEWIEASDVVPAPWRSTYILKPDMNLLVKSLNDYGWLSPILVREKTLEIIDGYSRWAIALQDKSIRKRDKGLVPVTFVKCSEVDAMIMHIRLNRGRGAVMAKGASHLVKEILRSKKYDPDSLMHLLDMSSDEIGVLMDGVLVKSKKVAEHQYSKAWVPVEAPANLKEQASFIERPPNKDR